MVDQLRIWLGPIILMVNQTRIDHFRKNSWEKIEIGWED